MSHVEVFFFLDHEQRNQCRRHMRDKNPYVALPEVTANRVDDILDILFQILLLFAHVIHMLAASELAATA